jgi:hypothetical protein
MTHGNVERTRYAVASVILVLLLAQSAHSLHGQEVTRILYLGDPTGTSPYLLLASEPGFQLTPIPSFDMATSYPRELGTRMMRHYFPRRYEEVVGFDVIVLSDVSMDLLTPGNVDSMARAVGEGGVGTAMIGGLDSFEGVGEPSWMDPPFGPVLPVTGGRSVWSTAAISWLDEEDPFIACLPFEEIGEHGSFSGYNRLNPKHGARTVALLQEGGEEQPLITYWNYGEGTVLAFASEWKGDAYVLFCRTDDECHLGGTLWGDSFSSWEYAPDFARNVVYLVAKTPFPRDLQKAHLFRTKLEEFELRRMLAHTTLEFLDRLAVPSSGVQAMMAEAESCIQEARDLYGRQVFDDSLEKADMAISKLSAAVWSTSELKKDSTHWMAVIQYLVVAGGVLLSALALEWAVLKARRPRKHRGP